MFSTLRTAEGKSHVLPDIRGRGAEVHGDVGCVVRERNRPLVVVTGLARLRESGGHPVAGADEGRLCVDVLRRVSNDPTSDLRSRNVQRHAADALFLLG